MHASILVHIVPFVHLRFLVQCSLCAADDQILDVVRVCNATLRRRLDEFYDTPSSELTPQVQHALCCFVF